MSKQVLDWDEQFQNNQTIRLLLQLLHLLQVLLLHILTLIFYLIDFHLNVRKVFLHYGGSRKRVFDSIITALYCVIPVYFIMLV